MQTLIVIVILAGAIFFVGRRFYHKVTKPAPTDCDCGCAGCSAAGSCSDKK